MSIHSFIHSFERLIFNPAAEIIASSLSRFSPMEVNAYVLRCTRLSKRVGGRDSPSRDRLFPYFFTRHQLRFFFFSASERASGHAWLHSRCINHVSATPPPLQDRESADSTTRVCPRARHEEKKRYLQNFASPPPASPLLALPSVSLQTGGRLRSGNRDQWRDCSFSRRDRILRGRI